MMCMAIVILRQNSIIFRLSLVTVACRSFFSCLVRVIQGALFDKNRCYGKLFILSLGYAKCFLSLSMQEQIMDKTGILLLHGLNGTLKDMAGFEARLQEMGFETRNVLLPGHGTTITELLSLGWEDWATAVEAEFLLLQERCEEIFLIGHSLGGALCLHLAAQYDVAGIVTMCAPIRMPFWMRPAVEIVRKLTPVLPTLREDIHDPLARKKYARGSYRAFPLPPISRMLDFLPTLRRELPQITAPALVMFATHDHVVPARDGREIYALLGSQEKSMEVFLNSFHVIMMDYEHERVFSSLVQFLQKYAKKTILTDLA